MVLCLIEMIHMTLMNIEKNPAFTEKGPELMQRAVRVLKKECFGEEI